MFAFIKISFFPDKGRLGKFGSYNSKTSWEHQGWEGWARAIPKKDRNPRNTVSSDLFGRFQIDGFSVF